jgi:hypothetical protein
LALSVSVEAQYAPPSVVQSCWLAPHDEEHVPFEHAWPDGHWVPHVPQLAGSSFVSTQTFPHWVVPEPQLVAQVPTEQTSLCAHAVPQTPQLSWSFFVSVHAPPQSSCPVVQTLASALLPSVPPSSLTVLVVEESPPLQPPCATNVAASTGTKHLPTATHGRPNQSFTMYPLPSKERAPDTMRAVSQGTRVRKARQPLG